jgi:hypothetical protein
MSKFAPLLLVIILLSCNSANQGAAPAVTADTISAASSYANYVKFRDKEQIEHVIFGFCENFDNGKLDRCLEFMDDSIQGSIDNIQLSGKANWKSKIDLLLESTKNSHFQPRHLLSNIQLFPQQNDTVGVSMYGSCFWTDLTTGQIQLMSIGSYQGKLVFKDGQWLITALNTLPDSRLVKYYYKDVIIVDSTLSL